VALAWPQAEDIQRMISVDFFEMRDVAGASQQSRSK
jgi:hypothetical protein